MGPVLVRNADRMMTWVNPSEAGLEIVFADGRRGLIPFSAIPAIAGLSGISEIELPNPYTVALRSKSGETVELPWDFARHYADEAYRPRVETLAAAGRQAIGARIHKLRKAAGKTQGELAAAAGIGRVTLVRIEKGEQSPRYETLLALAGALGIGMEAVVGAGQGSPS